MNDQIKHTILVIDDEEFILSSLYRLLRREFNVLVANSAQEGLELMRQHEVHVVVSDQRMPEMVGVEFFSIIKGEYPDAIRMLLTGYADLESVISAINTGNIYRYIVKPWNPDELITTVREACVKYDLIVTNRKLTKDLMESNIELEKRVIDRTNQLERSNKLITELNHAVIQLQNEFDLNNINLILEKELIQQNLHSSIVFFEANKTFLGGDRKTKNQDKRENQSNCHKILQSIPIFKKILENQEPAFLENFYDWYTQTFPLLNSTIPCASSEIGNVEIDSRGVCLPLKTREGFVGVMILWGRNLQKEDISPLVLFSNQIALILENAHYFEELKALAEIDFLTGIFNRRRILEIAEHEFKRAKRLNQDLSILMIDLNRFKQINDVYGHLVGDDVLTYAAKTMQSTIRKDVDTVGRYGGDEFLVILPGTMTEKAKIVLSRLKQNFSTNQVQFAQGLNQIFISVGIASLTDTVSSVSEMIEMADFEMYKEKFESASNR